MSVVIENFDDGLVIATDFIDTIETVTVSILVHTGSRNEIQELNGISHFLEHMAFKGTHNRTLKQIAEEFDEIGGNFNAYTSRETTVYYVKVMKENLTKAVDILADILLNSLYDESEIEKERGVIKQELAQTLDTPDDIVFDYFQETAYPNQPFGRSILGTTDFLNRVKRQDLIDYVHQRYGKKSIKIVAAGNVKHKPFVDLMYRKFAQLKSEASFEYEGAQYKGGYYFQNKPLEQVSIVFGIPGVSYLHPEYYAQQILAAIAGGSMSSRLFQEIRERRGLVYTVSAYGAGYRDCGMFNVYAGTSPEKTNEFIEAAIIELLKLKTDINVQEIDRAKSQIKTQIAMSFESSSFRAEKLASNLAIHGRYITIREIMSKIDQVNRDQLIKMANKFFHTNVKPTVAAIGKVDNIHSYQEITDMFQKNKV